VLQLKIQIFALHFIKQMNKFKNKLLLF